MEKMNLPLKQFLTLAGPAQVIEITEEDAEEPLFRGKAARIRDHEDLLNREVKFIQPVPDKDNTEKAIFKIWIY